ncbi:hypothetical protein V2K54_09350 [Pseudomonas alliivorans]|nr:hypothetical protein [Pseudomonas syringae]KTC11629.1 hypothetical protein AO390_09625 [Pseudomonas marginalis ICMP 11289]MEE5081249.1 hypothetical protein [Pseudomonas alliivorans]APQ05645.1 hypothetical protein PsaNZ47_24385 [Pseudomonas syringae pv. actinidiae]MEE5167910.1 hypothetical protein [Pseudomonas alliivorans]MEE5173904.1 hypothetical protein [Pseudomonas alliivorans]
MDTRQFATYVICLPICTNSRSALTAGLQDVVTRNGGVIIGQSMEDEMTLNELFEARLNAVDVREARSEAAALATGKVLGC